MSSTKIIRAGVLPTVVQHELDDQVAAWRHAVFTPAEFGDDPVGGLARLLAWPALATASAGGAKRMTTQP